MIKKKTRHVLRKLRAYERKGQAREQKKKHHHKRKREEDDEVRDYKDAA